MTKVCSHVCKNSAFINQVLKVIFHFVSLRRFFIHFCTCEVIFVMLAKLMCGLWHHQLKSVAIYVANIADFCRTGHIVVSDA